MTRISKSPYFGSPNLSIVDLFLNLAFLMIIVLIPSTATALIVYIDEPNTTYNVTIKKNLNINKVSDIKPNKPIPNPKVNLEKFLKTLPIDLRIVDISKNIFILLVLIKNFAIDIIDLDEVVYSVLDFCIEMGLIVSEDLTIELGLVVSNDSSKSVSDVILDVLSIDIVGHWSDSRLTDPNVDLVEPEEYDGESWVSFNIMNTIFTRILNMKSILMEFIN